MNLLTLITTITTFNMMCIWYFKILYSYGFGKVLDTVQSHITNGGLLQCVHLWKEEFHQFVTERLSRIELVVLDVWGILLIIWAYQIVSNF